MCIVIFCMERDYIMYSCWQQFNTTFRFWYYSRNGVAYPGVVVVSVDGEDGVLAYIFGVCICAVRSLRVWVLGNGTWQQRRIREWDMAQKVKIIEQYMAKKVD